MQSINKWSPVIVQFLCRCTLFALLVTIAALFLIPNAQSGMVHVKSCLYSDSEHFISSCLFSIKSGLQRGIARLPPGFGFLLSLLSDFDTELRAVGRSLLGTTDFGFV